MEFEVKKAKKIEDGSHEGAIVGVEYRETPYAYTDVVIEFEEGTKVKYGCPSEVTVESRLGKLLKFFGAQLTEGSKIDPAEVLVGKRCTFLTVCEFGKDGGSYAKVVNGSVKPVESESGSPLNVM